MQKSEVNSKKLVRFWCWIEVVKDQETVLSRGFGIMAVPESEEVLNIFLCCFLDFEARASFFL